MIAACDLLAADVVDARDPYLSTTREEVQELRDRLAVELDAAECND